MRRRLAPSRVAVAAALWVFTALWLLPFVALVVMSVKPYKEVVLNGWWTLQGNYSLENYVEVLLNPSFNFVKGLENSFVVASLSTVIPVVFAAMMAYSLTYLSFRYRTLLFVSILVFMSVPQQMVVIPLFSLYVKTGLHDKLAGIILLHSAWGTPWIAFFMRNYFRMLPQSFVEAARIDGASEFTIFWKILLPLSLPAVVAASAIQFTWVWGDFFYAMVFLPSPSNYVVTQRLALLKGEFHIDWGLLSAGAILAMLPPLLVYVAFKKYYVRGFAGWGVKG
ncbi:carbohydrate ABC transporter permease [Thermofilum pendens]|uniref:Binding-protein-dependent transport systems inner membrane component n=1 Tax=Thermofilum pendens (strain DSM 2475 / Hrk 5) TaxID=368408 RepID=A1S0K5_THEPD|nr:carbohydrate ABC transporter permease [Thermofilum pendens]ABL78985.1 binding-protein-dependent transport systems inner membrane component [Thermofilum pendens Hrk 5]